MLRKSSDHFFNDSLKGSLQSNYHSMISFFYLIQKRDLNL